MELMLKSATFSANVIKKRYLIVLTIGTGMSTIDFDLKCINCRIVDSVKLQSLSLRIYIVSSNRIRLEFKTE